MIRARSVSFGEAQGRAVVSRQPLNVLVALRKPFAWRHRLGKIDDPQHDLHGVRTAGRILVVPTLIGSTSSALILLEMIKARTAPRALILDEAGPLAAAAGVFAGELLGRPYPVADRPEADVFDCLRTGDRLRLVAEQDGATITVLR